MSWVNWSRKPAEPFAAAVGSLGVDLNSTRLRAMTAETGRAPRVVLLDDPAEDLPLAVALEQRVPEVGRSALALERRTPHLVCLDFLAEVGLPRRWEAGRHRFTASDLLELVFQRLKATCPRPENLTLTLPVYLTPPKVTVLAQLLERVKMPVRGSALLPLALLAAADQAERRPASTLIVDVDDHALTGSVVQTEANQARLWGATVQPKLNLRTWKDRLLNGLADRCVRVCRRDPRDSGTAEQALYEQIDGALERVRQGQRVDMTVRTTHWYQNLIQQSEDFEGYCAPLVRQAVAALHEMLAGAPEPPQAVWLTHAAGRLPGLAAALHAHMAERTGLCMLPADAGVRAAVVLAGRWVRDELPRTHLDSVILLPEAPARGAAPPQYREGNGVPTSFRGTRQR